MISTVVFDAVGTLIFADPPPCVVYFVAGERVGWNGTPELIDRRLRSAVQRWFRAGQELAVRDSPPSNGDSPEQRMNASDAGQRSRWRNVVAEVFYELDEFVVQRVFDELWLHFSLSSAWRLYDDVPSALECCRSTGLRCAIASNFDSRLHAIVAGHGQLAGLPVFTSSDLNAEKPQSEFFDRVRARLGVSRPDEILMIGDDREADYQGAQNAGWSAIWLDRSVQ